MAKKTYDSGYVFTKGTSGNTAVTLPVKAQPEDVLLIIHVPSKTTLYSFNDTTYSNVTFTNVQRSVAVTGTTTTGSTALTFTSTPWASINYNGAGGVQQGWRIAGTGIPATGNTVDYTDGSTTIYMDAPATASGTVTITFSDQNYVTQVSNIPVDTSSYSSSDRLLIIADAEAAPTVSFRDFLIDPVGKLRVSLPQSLIDTDFEYGPQPTKWQTVALINNWFASYGLNSDTSLAANIASMAGNGTSIVSVTTSSAHGLTSGQPIQVVGTSSANANGDFIVASTGSTSFNYLGVGTVTSGSIYQNGTIIYPGAFYTGAAIPLAGSIKTFGNTTVAVVTAAEHGLQVNNTLSIINSGAQTVIDTPATIATVPNARSFTYTLTSSPVAGAYTTSSVYVRPQGISYSKAYDGGITMTTNDTQPNSSIVRQTRKYFRYQSGKGVQVSFNVAFNNPAQASSNIANRAGVFDDQNGAFFEWDGTTLWAVRRSSVRQTTGTVTVTNGSSVITGTGTSFTTEVTVGQRVVLKGVSYKVNAINSNTSLTVSPAYRNDGSYSTQSGVNMSLTTDARIPQSGFNLNLADGSGVGGFKLDVSKAVMYYIDFAWYGAGSIRFGAKDQNGEILYMHKFVHGNNKTESYFRTGNLPLRYEVTNGNTAPAAAPTLFHWGTSMIMDGRFDTDRGYTYATAGTLKTISSGNPLTILNIRLAPTADSGIPGNYGIRDLTNHMQLWPAGVDITASQACLVQIVLNGNIATPSPIWTNVGGNSLTQYDNTGNVVTGGENVFQALTTTPPAPASIYSSTITYATSSFSLNDIKELNNAIYGGFNTYPDGPDTLSVVVSPLNSGTTVQARAVLRWSENQS